jgi:ERCC4-type nuclease
MIKIDIRETSVLQHIQKQIQSHASFQKLAVQSENLPLGDIVLCIHENNTFHEKIIIERKSVMDLLSSIKDGRYDEQSYRLNGLETFHNHNVVYLIEGDINRARISATEKTMIYSAMFSLNYFKGFSVFRSFSMEETAHIICNMAYKMQKEFEKCEKIPYYQTPIIMLDKQEINNQEINEEINEEINNQEIKEEEINNQEIKEEEQERVKQKYVEVVKKVKKENITPHNIGEIMLCQIPGISSVSAQAIMARHGTLFHLMKELEKNPHCLHEITYISAKGQNKKINNVAIQGITHYLFPTTV